RMIWAAVTLIVIALSVLCFPDVLPDRTLRFLHLAPQDWLKASSLPYWPNHSPYPWSIQAAPRLLSSEDVDVNGTAYPVLTAEHGRTARLYGFHAHFSLFPQGRDDLSWVV